MNLVVDIGNTSTKVAVFSGDEILFSRAYSPLIKLDCEELFNQFNVKAAIISSVGIESEEVLSFIERQVSHYIYMNEQTKVPILNAYTSPKTLGKDRLAVAVGANYLYPNTDVVVVDAGSALTFEYVDKMNTYRGGLISPGAQMRLKALHEFTAKLPLLELTDVEELIAINTKDAILGGVIHGMQAEIDSYVSHLKKGKEHFFAFLTGGDAFFFETKLKSSIFVSSNLLLLGLNRILNYNTCLVKE